MEITNTGIEELRKTVEGLILSYESQLSTVGRIVATTHGLVSDLRKERLEINSSLKQSLATNASLRRKDFDTMIMGLELYQEEREEEVKRKIDAFLKQQRGLVSELKALLEGVDSGDPGNFRTVISDIQRRQTEAAREVSETIRSFEKEHEQFAAEAHNFLTGTTSLSVADFKNWLRQFQKNANNSRVGKTLAG